MALAEPILKDSSLNAELLAEGLRSPTSMALIDNNKMLVLEKYKIVQDLLCFGCDCIIKSGLARFF